MKKKSALTYYLISVASVVAFIGIWWLVVETGIVSNKVLSSPPQVIVTFIDKLTNSQPDGAVLSEHLIASVTLVLMGYIAAAIFGVILGLLMGWFNMFEAIVSPLFELIRPIPPIAWIPVSIIWLGVGTVAKALIIFLTAFVPCVINSYTGIKRTPEVLIDAARTFGASNVTIFFKVGIPSSLMMVFTGLKVALSSSWMAVVAAELLGATVGIGYMIQIARNYARPDIIIVGMLVIGVIGSLLAWILDRIEAKIDTGRS